MDITQDILTKAEALFLTLGIRSISMDDICRELGMSKKTLYQYFDNKDALVKTVIESHVEREQEEIDEIVASSINAIDELCKIGSKVIRNIEDISASTLFDLQKYYRSSFDILMKKQDGFIFDCFNKNIKRGISEGLYRENVNPEIVAGMYAKTSQFIVDALSDPNFKYSRKQMINELYNYHVRGIATLKGVQLWEKYNKVENQN